MRCIITIRKKVIVQQIIVTMGWLCTTKKKGVAYRC
jgi:hypothetical protein